MERLNRYAEEFPQGSVVYYIETKPDGYVVGFGLADEYFHDALYIKLLHLKDTRLINNIPYNELKHPLENKSYLKGGHIGHLYLMRIMTPHVMKSFVK